VGPWAIKKVDAVEVSEERAENIEGERKAEVFERTG